MQEGNTMLCLAYLDRQERGIIALAMLAELGDFGFVEGSLSGHVCECGRNRAGGHILKKVNMTRRRLKGHHQARSGRSTESHGPR